MDKNFYTFLREKLDERSNKFNEPHLHYSYSIFRGTYSPSTEIVNIECKTTIETKEVILFRVSFKMPYFYKYPSSENHRWTFGENLIPEGFIDDVQSYYAEWKGAN